MKPSQMKRIANSEVDKLNKIKQCPEHKWDGPSQEVQWGDAIKHLYHCKHCPLAKLFDKESELCNA